MGLFTTTSNRTCALASFAAKYGLGAPVGVATALVRNTTVA